MKVISNYLSGNHVMQQLPGNPLALPAGDEPRDPARGLPVRISVVQEQEFPFRRHRRKTKHREDDAARMQCDIGALIYSGCQRILQIEYKLIPL